jgi:hypothetical protein
LHVCHILYRLNLSFSNIVGHCRALQETGSVTAKSSKLFQGYVQELQAEINQELLETMHATELEDWGTFGKIRQAEKSGFATPMTCSFTPKNERTDCKGTQENQAREIKA